MAASDRDRSARSIVLAMALLPALAGASDWPDPRVPDGMSTAAISSHLIYNGIDMRSQVFTSAQSAAEVVTFYRHLWGRQSVVNQLSPWQVVGHRDGDFFLTVQVRADGSGSRGDIGIVRLRADDHRAVLGQGVPQPSNTRVINDIAYPDDATPARTLALVNTLSVQQNASYYRDHLAASGWKPAEAGACAPAAASCVMNYAQGNRKLTLALSARAGRSEIVINMMGKGVMP